MYLSLPHYVDLPGPLPALRWGRGPRQLIVFAGGPGNTRPGRLGFPLFARGLAPFLQDFTVTIVRRRQGLPVGFSLRDMSDDYAAMVRGSFGGRVDLVIGSSYGGLIAQYFAADHPGLFNHLVIARAAHKISPLGRAVDGRFALLASQGHPRAAAAASAAALYPRGPARPLAQALFWLAGDAFAGRKHPQFASDILVEAQAEQNHDAQAADNLGRIRVPVLIVGGTRDAYFPREYTEEMAALIARSTLKLYEGRGHASITGDPRFAPDVYEFMAAH